MVTADVDVAALTPSMRQMVDAKRKHPDAIIFFRMGDFYELFFEDAIDGSRLLDLTLTSRNKADPRPIPMCGFPHHQMSAYVQKALEAGRRCAIVEQLEDPAQAKGVVQRGVTHVITPGVVLEPESLDASRGNCLVALVPGRNGGLELATADVSTGECAVTAVQHPLALAVLLVRLEPREIVATAAAEVWLDSASGVREIPRAIRALPAMPSSTAVGDLAMGLLRQYLAEVRPGADRLLQSPEALQITGQMQLGRETVQHLELLTTARHGRREGSLLFAVDRTATGPGARLLRALLLAPLCDRPALELRLAAVQALVLDRPARGQLRQILKRHGDLARIATRALAGLSSPREMAALRDTLQTLPTIEELLGNIGDSVALATLGQSMRGGETLLTRLQAALADVPRHTTAEGGVIRSGFDAELDEFVELTERSHEWLARFEVQEREQCAIPTLKVTYNRVSGYGIEIGRSRADQVPPHYHRKQTLKNTERYTTDALVAFERKLAGAEQGRIARETELFRLLVTQVGAHTPLLRRFAHALAELDLHQGFAELAAERRYVRPQLTDEPGLRLKAARHPVVEQRLPAGSFVPNDLELLPEPEPVADGDVPSAQVLLVTGPNMAGKSTLMRTAALAVILAQCGSFVPAESAILGVHDAVLTRIGAGDDISGGASTFMVEMRETADLLQRATPRSLVLLDEIGRGTSTWDGLSIAWAVVEALHERRSLTLFATHYHELTRLSEQLPRLRNAHVAVRTFGDDIVFVHALQPGPTSRSHGIAVARLAGLPDALLQRAQNLLEQFENTGHDARAKPQRQLGLFDLPPRPAPIPVQPAPEPPQPTLVQPPQPVDPTLLALLQAATALRPDDLSPRQAQDVTYEIAQIASRFSPAVLQLLSGLPAPGQAKPAQAQKPIENAG